MDIFNHLCSSVIKTKRVGYLKNTLGGVKWVSVTQKWYEMSKTANSSFSHPFEYLGPFSPTKSVSKVPFPLSFDNRGTEVEYIHFSGNDFLVFSSDFVTLKGGSVGV